MIRITDCYGTGFLVRDFVNAHVTLAAVIVLKMSCAFFVVGLEAPVLMLLIAVVRYQAADNEERRL